MHENVIPAGCGQVLTFKKLKKLMETPPQVDRNRTPPPCRICPFYQLPSATANASMLSVPMERTDVRPSAEDR